MNREDFPILKNNLIYFDSAATMLKPQVVIDEINNYYQNNSANAHRGDYDLSYTVSTAYEHVREITKNFINAASINEIVFTSGTTQALNMICDGYFREHLQAGDEIILNKSEHAANLLPWFRLAQDLKLNIIYLELDENYQVTINNLQKLLTPKTKLIALAQITNVIGDIRPIKEICQIAHQQDTLVVVDGAQSVAHLSIDVQDLDCDFFAFSAHKLGGGTGTGVLYAKAHLLVAFLPQNLGGGMNESFDTATSVIYKAIPTLLEAGTPNVAGVLSLGAAISYLQKIGLAKINTYEQELRVYLISQLKTIPHVVIINEKAQGSIVTFNIKDIFSQDIACYLNKYQICLRAGNHCAKMLKDVTHQNNTCRISLSFYNTKAEVDTLVNLLSDKERILKEMF